MKAGTIKFYADAKKVPGYAWVVRMLDDSTQGRSIRLSSHDNDKIDGFIICQPVLSNGGVMLAFDPSNPGQYTVSGTLSHEVCRNI